LYSLDAVGTGRALLLAEAIDLQIVNGAQTTASLAAARRERKVPLDDVFVPMKLSVVPGELAGEMIPRISTVREQPESGPCKRLLRQS
jgi:hypothetical protein